MAALPHESVYARLAASDIHGVGVFAICAIPSGTEIFANDRMPIVWIGEAEVNRDLGAEHARLYSDFGVRVHGKIGCPVNFNNLTTGWYLNQPPNGVEGNVRSDNELRFFSSRDIAEGEELTIDYSQFAGLIEHG